MVLKYWKTGFLLLGAISMLVMSLHYFQSESTGILKNKDITSSSFYVLCLRLHIGLGILAIFLGPTQFVKKIRIKYKNAHRKMGYLYSLAVVFSAITGLFVAQFAMGGTITRIGFTVLAIFWLISIIMALRAILKKDFTRHERWMYLNYGLTFAAITQRTLLLMPIIFSVDFMSIYQLSAWVPWIMNTTIVLYLIRTPQSNKTRTIR